MEKKMFSRNGEMVEFDVVKKTIKDKEFSFVVVDNYEIPMNKNGLTKEFMKNFVKTKEKEVRLWYLNLCKKLTTIEKSEALGKDCATLDVESLRKAFIKKFNLEFVYKKVSTYKTYIDELEAELFGEEEVEENLKKSA